MAVFGDNAQSIGGTPLVRLNRITDGAKATVLAKIEGRHPAYSVKCRIGAAMIWDAEKRGLLGPGKELVEPTSGNTGLRWRSWPRHVQFVDAHHARDHEHRAAQAADRLWCQAGAHGRCEGHERRDRQGQ